MKIFGIDTTDIEFNDLEIENVSEDFDSIIEEKTKEERGFIGKAFIYDKELYINTFTGEGYDEVISKMRNYISWYAGKIRLSGFDKEDIKQLIITILLDGIRRFNNELDVKLSTFLYVHIKNRLISRIKEEMRQGSNASYNVLLHKFICNCEHSFVIEKKIGVLLNCENCGSNVDETWKIRAEHYRAISLEDLSYDNNSSPGGAVDDDSDKASRLHLKECNLFDFFGRIDTAEDVERKIDFSSILVNEDEKTKKIASLMYNEDYSITAAAKEVNLSCWAASLRLKKMKTKKEVQEFFLDK